MGRKMGRLWSILKCSLAQKLDWHLSLCYPSDISAAAAELDSVLWDMLEHVTKLHIPKGEEGLGIECILQVPGITSLQGRSFQNILIRQPVKKGGAWPSLYGGDKFGSFCGWGGDGPSPLYR